VNNIEFDNYYHQRMEKKFQELKKQIEKERLLSFSRFNALEQKLEKMKKRFYGG